MKAIPPLLYLRCCLARRHAESGTEYFINVRDDARLHVAATIDASLSNERIFAFAEPYN
jgi:hypothetical protein